MSDVVLLACDNKNITANTVAALEFLDQEVVVINDSDLLARQLSESPFLLAILSFGNNDSETLALQQIKDLTPALPVCILHSSDLADSPHNVNAMGPEITVLQYPTKYKEMLGVLKRAKLKLADDAQGNLPRIPLTGCSAAINRVKDLIRQVARTDANVLLSGESGTGKEVVARSIHNLSERSDQPFVAVNCGAIPAELLESELFGHEKGSFTGAFKARAGRFELAAGGTLFLDEIGDMPLSMQVNLLRVLQEKTFERVGGTRTLKSDVRLIAATHRDLEKRVAEGKFRLDLFYRLNVFPIDLPSLRERPDDIPHLIEDFVTDMATKLDSAIAFDDSALEALVTHPMPGNVRELENLVERLSILYAGETITSGKLPERYQAQPSVRPSGLPAGAEPQLPAVPLNSTALDFREKINLKQYLSYLERTLICQSLEKSDWVVTQAAKSLSLQRTTLIEKIRKLDIKQPTGSATEH